MLTKDCLIKALQNISGKTIPDDVLAKCDTTCGVLNAFNDMYKCLVTFQGILGSTNVTSTMSMTVKDAAGNVIAPQSPNEYLLAEGTYSYSATCAGAVAKTDVGFEITNSDEQSGKKSVVITFTADA